MKRILGVLVAACLTSSCAHKTPTNVQTSHQWFAAHAEDYKESIDNLRKKDPFLKQAPVVMSLQTLSPSSFVWKDGKASIEGWEDSISDAWWVDLMHLETSAALVAQSQSLRNYVPGTCWRSYKEGLGALAEGTRAPQPTLASAPVVDDSDDIATRPSTDWQAAAGIPLHESWKPAFQKGLRADQVIQELRKVSPTRFEALLMNGSWIGFQEIEGGEQFKSGCERFIFLSRALKTEARCLTIDKRNYAVIPLATQLRHIKTSRLTQDKLTGLLAWMCRELAATHFSQMRPAEARALYLSLEYNPTLLEKLNHWATEESGRALADYRSELSP